MEILGGLPTELTCLLLREWLDLREVGQLDSACASHVSRDSLLAAYASPQCVLVGWPKMQRSDKYMQWICRKEIRVENVTITPSMAFLPFLDYVKKYGGFVRRMKAFQTTYLSEEGRNLFLRVVYSCRWCNNLSTLSCDQVELANSIFDVLRFCPLIQHLHFSRCDRNTDRGVSKRRAANLKHIHLRSLTVVACTNVDKCVRAILASVAPHCLERLAVPTVAVGDVYRRHSQQFTNLQAVRLSGLRSFGTDAPLGVLASTAPHIAHLDLEFTRIVPAVDFISPVIFQSLRELRSLKLIEQYDSLAVLRTVEALAFARHSSIEQLYFEHAVLAEPDATSMRQAFKSVLTNCPSIHTVSALEATTASVPSQSALFRAFADLVIECAEDGADLPVPCFRHLQHVRFSVSRAAFQAFDFTLLTTQRLPALRTLVLVLFGSLLSANPTVALLQAARPELHITRDASALEYDFMKLSLK